MTPAERKEKLESLLAELEPQKLVVEDDSFRHRNHAGAADGRSHFKALIVSDAFQGMSRIKRHQLVYSLVGDLMKTDIHALQLVTLTLAEHNIG
jgi:BolA protein